jgi:hypothetical protein
MSDSRYMNAGGSRTNQSCYPSIYVAGEALFRAKRVKFHLLFDRIDQD